MTELPPGGPVRHSFEVMGTVASIAVSSTDVLALGSGCIASILADAESLLLELDLRFSHYRQGSAIRRWERGESIDAADVAEIERVMAACADLAAESGGVFSSRNPRTGALDTAGFVKGHAIGRAASLLEGRGLGNFLLGVGGDVQGRGRADEGRPWRVAIQDPDRSHGILALIDATDLAVATSGRAQRGDHLWSLDWAGSAPASAAGVASFTVIGPHIEQADAFATIGFAMGEPGMDWVARHEGYRSVLVRGDGSVSSDAALVSPA